MLETALTAKSRGQDVVIGIVDDSTGEKVKQLISEFEKLEPLMLESEHQSFEVLNLNLAISRHPDVILIDHLEENNPVGCRHNKRYQDVLELCHEGIDVYTTVNVQNIESLNDAVVNILGNRENKRIPDSLFDEASQVKLVDIEPIDLIEKNKGSDYKISLDQYTALRALALKKCSDRLLELNRQVHYQTDEHVLVCLSSAPSNQKIIRAAARMAKAFHCPFTALYVKTELTDRLSTEDEKRLQANIYLATQLGASIETVYGDDIAYQIAEFARLSNVTKIVIGRAASTRHLFLGKRV